MRKLFAVLILVTLPAAANEVSVRSLQSGSTYGGTPLYDHGLHGEGQVVAVLDTGVDVTICYFAEADGSLPPFNTGTPTGGLQSSNVNPARRKVIAYDFLYSCDQFPGAHGCETPGVDSFDNQGHGTHAAASAVGDKGTPIAHDYADAIATGAKLVVQDAGYIGGDNCSQRPGIGCPVNLTPILAQAYAQGARIHSNSWGDRQNVPPVVNAPTANYSTSARDVDAFVYSHPDMLVVFNTGNYSANAVPPASSLSAPGCAKNTLQVGGTRGGGYFDDTLASYSLAGPTRDGRLKPDLVGPATVTAGDAQFATKSSCGFSTQDGTSWSSPTLAGAAALVRQYYTDGYYPTGVPTPSNRFTPSAALLKATMIAAARSVPHRWSGSGLVDAAPAPSPQQGFGFPVLDDALYFPGDTAKLRTVDVPLANGLTDGETATLRVSAKSGTPLKAVLVWTDPAGVPRGTTDATPELVNDLDLRVTAPDGTTIFGNEALHPGQPDRLNNVEVAPVGQPVSGVYTVTVTANHIAAGPRQSYALVITGDVTDAAGPAPAAARRRSARH